MTEMSLIFLPPPLHGSFLFKAEPNYVYTIFFLSLKNTHSFMNGLEKMLVILDPKNRKS